MEKCLRQYERMASNGEIFTIRVNISKERANEFLSSPVLEDRLLAIRLLPWLEREERFVHDRIIETIRTNRDRAEIVAALGSLRLSRGAVELATVADVELLKSLLDSKHRDVRVAVCRALSSFPTDSSILDVLLERLKHTNKAEFRENLRVIVQFGAKQEWAKRFVLDETERRLGSDGVGNANEQYELKRLLVACEELGGEASPEMERRLRGIADSYKFSRELRQQAMRTFGRVAIPRPVTVIEFVKRLDSGDPILAPIIGGAVQRLCAKGSAKGRSRTFDLRVASCSCRGTYPPVDTCKAVSNVADR